MMRDPRILSFHAGLVAEGKYAFRPAGDPTTAAAALLQAERERLANATLYWIAPEMTQIAKAAAQTLPHDLRIDRTHQPAEHGFIIFGDPVGSYIGDQYRDRRIGISAMTWGPAPYPIGRDAATWVTFYSRRDDDYLRHILPRLIGRKPRPRDYDAAIHATPEWMWDNEIALTHAGTIGDLNRLHQLTATATDQSVIPWLTVLYASWLLMTQPGITETSHHPANRQQQRRDRRQGMRNSDVRIVHVHRKHRDTPTGTPDGTSAGATTTNREYTCRWMVRGHWRNQAYGPNRSLRRPTWILPHLKGPDDKPLNTNTIVHVWDQ